jgi:hypothetical protein
MNNLIINNLQRWTPISIIILIGVGVLCFIVIWDTIQGISLSPYVVSLLSFMLGGTGVSAAITHGNNLATQQTETTAKVAALTATSTANLMIPNGETHS